MSDSHGTISTNSDIEFAYGVFLTHITARTPEGIKWLVDNMCLDKLYSVTIHREHTDEIKDLIEKAGLKVEER